MLKSVKSQIIAATSLIIIMILSATAYFILDQKVKEINHDIYDNALSFAELTHERVIRNYETNYKEHAYANFEKDLADVYVLNPDVPEIRIYGYKGDVLYQPEGQAPEVVSDEDLQRIQYVYPSVKIKKSGRVVYLEKNEQGIRYTDENGRSAVEVMPTEQIMDVIYPFKDPNNALRSYSIRYAVSYDALMARIKDTAFNIVVLAVFGILIAIFTGSLVAGRITSPIKALSEGAAKIGKGDLKTRIVVKSKTEVGLLAETFNLMAADLEKSTQERIEKEKIKGELALAGQIQRDLLPKILPKIRNLDIAASLVSAEEVGGDCYDFIPVGSDNLMFYVADVTGHGVPAGLVSAINNALIPALLDQYKTTYELIVHLNKILKTKTQPNVFMTMVLANWDVDAAKLSFTQAGHDPILRFSAKRNVVDDLGHGGMALGMIPDLSKVVKTDEVFLEVGDVIVMYTDGIPEAWKNDKETLGMDRLKALISQHASSKKTAQEIHDSLLKDVREFMGSYPQADDITLVVAKRTN